MKSNKTNYNTQKSSSGTGKVAAERISDNVKPQRAAQLRDNYKYF